MAAHTLMYAISRNAAIKALEKEKINYKERNASASDAFLANRTKAMKEMQRGRETVS